MSITINSLEKSFIQYARMPSPIDQYVINLFATLPIERGPGALMNVLVWEHGALNNQNS
jgi:hypothetical protein